MSPGMSRSSSVRSLSKRILIAAGLSFSRVFDHAQHLVEAALAVAADRGVERQRGAPGAAEQLVDRLAEQLALDVPQRDVERGQRAGQRALRPELDAGVQQRVEQHGMIERVLADQRRRQVVADDAERGEAALHRRRLADAVDAVIGVDAHEGAVLRRLVVRRPAHLEGVDAGDLHGAAPSLSLQSTPAPARRQAAGPWRC